MRISGLVMQIHSNYMLNIGIKKEVKICFFPMWGGCRHMSSAPPLKSYYNSETKFMQIVKIFMQIHANYMLNIRIEKYLKISNFNVRGGWRHAQIR